MGQTVGQPSAKASSRRNKLLFVFGAILLLGVGGMIATETIHALSVRAKTGSVFNTYVIDHHIGIADISDDASGFQSDFCVLHLNQPIPDKQLEQQALSLMHQYYKLDGGNSMTIVYSSRGSDKSVTQADAYYHSADQTVLLTLNTASGKKLVSEHVNWPSNGAN
ncbi:hypothetical protein LLE49_21095 [Alicyclobacillus tolerans]|uniref:hypothetical protein n=1 Tax=Alicyclobacillus tolerans TaxID=90970 RepID=UPI001F31286E|nr:hypothetical protein [Alicyclobacillus tolerans]MCF8567221.1 hypothetical protein [Alicyclobacillus tolerans]